MNIRDVGVGLFLFVVMIKNVVRQNGCFIDQSVVFGFRPLGEGLGGLPSDSGHVKFKLNVPVKLTETFRRGQMLLEVFVRSQKLVHSGEKSGEHVHRRRRIHPVGVVVEVDRSDGGYAGESGAEDNGNGDAV